VNFLRQHWLLVLVVIANIALSLTVKAPSRDSVEPAAVFLRGMRWGAMIIGFGGLLLLLQLALSR
jgi:hypothetical protein